MQIPILPQAAVHNLYTNVKKNKNFYLLGEGSIIDTDTLKNLNETKMPQDPGAQMVTDSKIPEGKLDAANSVIIFKMLENLSAYQARDERIWCALTHLYFREYTVFRHKISDSKFDTSVQNHFFARNAGFRSLERLNSISRLWWHGYFIERCRENNDFDELVYLLCSDTDFRQQLVERPEISKIPKVALAILLCKKRLNEEQPNNEFFKGRAKTAPYRLWFKRLSMEGGRVLLSAMTSEELTDLFWKFLEEINR